MPEPNEPADSEAGLCAGCRHAQVHESNRGSRFWRCLRADSDDTLRRYPRLPVLACTGFEPARAAPAGGEG